MRRLRREKYWTQNQLAEHSKVSRATIACIELAHGDVPLSTLSRLAYALGRPTAILLIPQPGAAPTIGY